MDEQVGRRQKMKLTLELNRHGNKRVRITVELLCPLFSRHGLRFNNDRSRGTNTVETSADWNL